MSALRTRLADGRWHRVRPTELRGLHNEADMGAGLMPLHVEVDGAMARRADKASCTLCAEDRATVALLRRRIEAIEGRVA